MSGRLQATACAGLLCISLGAAGQEDAPGWTGITNVDDLIAARQALMGEIERLMLPIDLYTVGEQEDIEEIHSAATSIAQMLVATPHLFPPTTNLYDAEAEFPKTIAMPAVWENFSTFYSMANAASELRSRGERENCNESPWQE